MDDQAGFRRRTLARYFKFHSLSDLETECTRLGLELHFRDDFSPLFQPQTVGSLRAGNRLCVQPMEGCDGTLDGHPDELTYRRYQRFGAGGAKLIWGEATAVVEEGRANSRQLLLNEQTAPNLERLLRECRQAHRDALGSDADLIIGLQLTHSGRYSYRRPLLAFHDPLLDPRTILDKSTGRTVDASYPLLSDDDLIHGREQRPFFQVLDSEHGGALTAVDLGGCKPHRMSHGLLPLSGS